MAAGDKWFDCTPAKIGLGIESILKLLLVDDGNQNPAVRVYVTNSASSGAVNIEYPANSAVTENYFTGADNAATIAALQSWKGSNGSRKIIETVNMIGNDGVSGIMIRHVA